MSGHSGAIDPILDHLDQVVMPSQGGFQFPVDVGEPVGQSVAVFGQVPGGMPSCLLYTSDAADDLL